MRTMMRSAVLAALVACALLLAQGQARAAAPVLPASPPPVSEASLWRVLVEESAERRACDEAIPLFERSGADWGANPEHRPGLLYLWVALRDRCMADADSWTSRDDELAKRLGAPFDLARLDAVLSQFPLAMRHLSRLWPFFVETTAERRIDVVDRHVVAFVAGARSIDHCSAADGRAPCERTIVHARLVSFASFLAEKRDERSLRSFHLALVAAADSATLRVVFGDLIDATARKPVAAASSGPRSASPPRRTAEPPGSERADTSGY